MKLCKCNGNLMNYYHEVMIRDGEICAAVWCGSVWKVYHTVSINGFRYVDVRDTGRSVTETMFDNRFEEVDA